MEAAKITATDSVGGRNSEIIIIIKKKSTVNSRKRSEETCPLILERWTGCSCFSIISRSFLLVLEIYRPACFRYLSKLQTVWRCFNSLLLQLCASFTHLLCASLAVGLCNKAPFCLDLNPTSISGEFLLHFSFLCSKLKTESSKHTLLSLPLHFYLGMFLCGRWVQAPPPANELWGEQKRTQLCLISMHLQLHAKVSFFS